MAKKLKAVSGKKHAQIVAELTQRAEEAEMLSSQREHDLQYYKRRFNEAQEKVDAANNNKAMADGGSLRSRDALETSAHLALDQLVAVKPTEHDYLSLQRVLGAVQGILTSGLGRNRNVRPIDLYPEETNARRNAEDFARFQANKGFRD